MSAWSSNLMPIFVSGPFDRVGVDVIQFRKLAKGNCYAIVFIDYLTKWPQVFAFPDLTSITIVRLLVEHIIPRHGVRTEHCLIMGRPFCPRWCVSTSCLEFTNSIRVAYYGFVERFDRILTDMLAKTMKQGGRLGYALAVCFVRLLSEFARIHLGVPLFLYDRDPKLPMMLW